MIKCTIIDQLEVFMIGANSLGQFVIEYLCDMSRVDQLVADLGNQTADKTLLLEIITNCHNTDHYTNLLSALCAIKNMKSSTLFSPFKTKESAALKKALYEYIHAEMINNIGQKIFALATATLVESIFTSLFDDVGLLFKLAMILVVSHVVASHIPEQLNNILAHVAQHKQHKMAPLLKNPFIKNYIKEKCEKYSLMLKGVNQETLQSSIKLMAPKIETMHQKALA